MSLAPGHLSLSLTHLFPTIPKTNVSVSTTNSTDNSVQQVIKQPPRLSYPSMHLVPVTSFLQKKTQKDFLVVHASQNKFQTAEARRDMSGPSKLGKALTLVFVVSLVALLAELLFVLWRRRLLRRQGPPEIDQPGLTSNNSSSKEFLYFFCLKSQSRVEPAGTGEVGASDGSPVDDPMEVIDVFKLRDMYGPSRVLFTIKEEEREDLESEKSLSISASNKTRTRNLSQCFEDTATSPELVVAIDGDEEEEDIEATPFSTPCASPLYFTPSASPLHQ